MPKSILVVDEAEFAAVVARLLRSHGYDVLQSDSGTAAMDLCRDPSQPIDLVLADVRLAQVGGRELATALREIRPDVRIMLMSGQSTEPPGVLDVPSIRKPFGTGALLHVLKSQLSVDT